MKGACSARRRRVVGEASKKRTRSSRRRLETRSRLGAIAKRLFALGDERGREKIHGHSKWGENKGKRAKTLGKSGFWGLGEAVEARWGGSGEERAC